MGLPEKKFTLELSSGQHYESRFILSSETDDKHLFELISVQKGHVAHTISIRADKCDKSGIVKESSVRSLDTSQHSFITKVPSMEEIRRENSSNRIWMVVSVSNPYWRNAEVVYNGAILANVEGSEAQVKLWLMEMGKTQMVKQISTLLEELGGFRVCEQQDLVAYLRLDGKNNSKLVHQLRKFSEEYLEECIKEGSLSGGKTGRYTGAMSAATCAVYALSASSWPVLIGGVPVITLLGYLGGKWAGAKAGGSAGRQADCFEDARLNGANRGLVAGAAAGAVIGGVGYALLVKGFGIVNMVLNYIVKYARELWPGIQKFTSSSKAARDSVLAKVQAILEEIKAPPRLAETLLSILSILAYIKEDMANGCPVAKGSS